MPLDVDGPIGESSADESTGVISVGGSGVPDGALNRITSSLQGRVAGTVNSCYQRGVLPTMCAQSCSFLALRGTAVYSTARHIHEEIC